LKAVTKHPYFRRAHPREEHFVPIYVAAGAGMEGKARVVSDLHGAITIVFGL
jgi:aromatic ring-opening dioxygenase catalytic subunit (LigB family)